MIRCYLRGSIGDALHAIALGDPVRCATGYNIRWLMRAIMRLGLRGLSAFAFLTAWFTAIRRSGSPIVSAVINTQSTPKIRARYALI